MLATAWSDRGGERVEVTVTEALEDRAGTYRCLACDQPVIPREANTGDGARAHFEHVTGAGPCQRNPRRPDRRKSMRAGGRRVAD